MEKVNIRNLRVRVFTSPIGKLSALPLYRVTILAANECYRCRDAELLIN
jgi:hypothetical protein